MSKPIVVLVVLFGLIGGYFVLTAVLNNLDTNKKTERLANSGKKLDELEQQFKQTNLDIQTFRDEYCWRTTEKYSNGSLYCEQRLLAIGLDKTTDVQIQESSELLPIVEKLFEKEFYSESFRVYKTTGYIRQSATLSPYSKNSAKCTLVYNALDESRTVDELSRNVYVIDITCNEYIKTTNIYPTTMDTSWESYITSKE